MKILNIQFKNINSVAGENRVDFSRAPFADAGVFAITGPNGSGKTTLLDAITLGLYGETYRFDRPAAHVMTRHTAESYAAVEFAVGEHRYRSSWSVKREKQEPNGRLLAPEMALIQLTENDRVLAENPQSVCQRVTEITGMNFRNFTRSIMLAQGDFAAFLNALDAERLDILEKIISPDVYSDYKNNILVKADEAQTTLTLLEEEIEALELLEPERIEACEQDLADFKEQLEAFEQQHATLEQQRQWRLQVDEGERRIAALDESREALATELERDQKQLARIAESQGASAFKGDSERLETSKKNIEETRLMLAAYRNELQQLQQKLAASGGSSEAGPAHPLKSVSEQQAAIAAEQEKIAQYKLEQQAERNVLLTLDQQRDEKQTALAAVMTWLDDHVTDESLLENFPETGKLKKLRARIATLTDSHKSAAKWLQTTDSTLKKNKATIRKSTRKISKLKLKQQIGEQRLEGMALGRNAEQIDELLKEQQERVADFGKLYELSRAHARLTGGRFALFGLASRADARSLSELRSELTHFRENLRLEENIQIALEQAVANEALLAKMVEFRHYLEPGRPCPLCGALAHPYALKPPVSADSKATLTAQQTKIQALNAGIERIQAQIATLEQQSEADQAKAQRAAQLRSQWSSLCNRLNAVSEDLDVNNFRKIKRLLKTEQTELKNIASLAKKYRLTQKNVERSRLLISRHEALIEELNENSRKLDGQWQNRPQELAEQEQALAQCRQEEKELLAKVTEQLALVGEKMPSKGKEDAFFDRMNQRRQEYQSYHIKHNHLTTELAALAKKIAAGKQAMAVLEQKLDACKQRLQQEEFVGLHLALIEKQKLIDEKERLLERQIQELDGINKSLQEKLRETPWQTVDELVEMLELIERKAELEQQVAALTSRLEALTNDLEQARSALESRRAEALTEAGADDIAAQLRAAAEKTDITRHEIQRLERTLGQQEMRRRKYEALASKHEAQQEIYQECRAEAEQLEAEQGGAFRRRVQVKMADKLLAKANQILEQINGRYYLRQMPSEQGLALEIEDTYQRNARRLPKTLSGGESFVVSLALALALSDLAANGRSMDSMFLDEGFGSLDAETLYVVISTLEGLHTQGKKVGVISHVEAVQKRIKAQLQMGKRPDGASYLKTVPEQEVAV